MAKRELALIPPQLVADLQTIFPQKVIQDGETEAQARKRAGIQYLIDWLLIKSTAQQEALSGVPEAMAALDGIFGDEDDEPGSTSVEMQT